MKNEKVLRIELTKGAQYRRVEVTDGIVSIVYAEESVKETKASNEVEAKKATQEAESQKQFINKRIKRVSHFGLSSPTETIVEDSSKPAPLIGGTEVYQKDNGTNYWYCRIKNGRDEFMYVPFDDLTEHDLLYDADGKKRVFSTRRKKEFRDDVLKALKTKPKNGFVWIPVYEPSKAKGGSIQYVSGEKVLFIGINEWEKILNNYSPENGSQMASVTIYFLLLLRWLKDGVVTISQIADDSTEIGNFDNGQIERTGARMFGGLYGFAGNTYKIVFVYGSSYDYAVIGGNWINKSSLSDLVYGNF